jgi:WD40 repeat protein
MQRAFLLVLGIIAAGMMAITLLHLEEGPADEAPERSRFAPGASANADLTPEYPLDSSLRSEEVKPFITVTNDVIAIAHAHQGWIRALEFSSDGKILASGSSDATIKVWNAVTGRNLRTFGNANPLIISGMMPKDLKSLCYVAFSPDGRLVAAWDPGEEVIWLLDVASGKRGKRLKGHTRFVCGGAFSPNSKTLASTSDDGTIRLWDVATGKQTAIFRCRYHPYSYVVFDTGGRMLASTSNDGLIYIWDLRTAKVTATLINHTGLLSSIALSPSGQILASGSRASIKLWDVETGRNTAIWRGDIEPITSVAFSPDGQFLASGGYDKLVRLWQASSGKSVQTFRGHPDYVMSLAYSPDGRSIASGGFKGTIHVWKLKDQLKSGK